MDKNKRQEWNKFKVEMREKIESVDNPMDALMLMMVGLPSIMMLMDGGSEQEIKDYGKEMFVLAVDTLDKNGMNVVRGSEIDELYQTIKKEMKPDTAKTPLPSAFERITLDDILNAPVNKGLPNN